jgi:hypothetical protein
MGKFEDTITFSGKTYEHITNDEIVKQARDIPPNCGIVAFNKRPKKKLKPNCWTYIDDNGNIIQDEVEKVLRNKTNG